MSKEMMSTPVETDGDGSADLIADLLEFLLDPDDDEAPPSEERLAYEASGSDQMNQ
jgi:hypothetical protein